MSLADQSEKAQAAARRLLAVEPYRRARAVLVYLALSDEVSTERIIADAYERGSVVAAPVVDRVSGRMTARAFAGPDELVTGPFGIAEPQAGARLDPGEIDFVVVPGRAFDRAGGRVGRGAGFYDRFLAEAAGAYRCALAYECQVFEHLATDGRDMPVDALVTEDRVRLFPRDGAGRNP